jgi:hypothetical protein
LFRYANTTTIVRSSRQFVKYGEFKYCAVEILILGVPVFHRNVRIASLSGRYCSSSAEFTAEHRERGMAGNLLRSNPCNLMQVMLTQEKMMPEFDQSSHPSPLPDTCAILFFTIAPYVTSKRKHPPS